MGNFATIIEKIRERNEAPILIYNMSPVTPGEMIHCHQGFDDVYSSRIRRFNLGLIELSEKTGISIIDVDSLLARKGTDALKVDTLHLKPEAYELIAAEVVRVLDDLGVLADN
jgi:lysophospholipase L1-like esterase